MKFTFDPFGSITKISWLTAQLNYLHAAAYLCLLQPYLTLTITKESTEQVRLLDLPKASTKQSEPKSTVRHRASHPSPTPAICSPLEFYSQAWTKPS